MAYRLLALDLDGTLMGPDLLIADTVKRAVADAKAQGIIVTVATGRVFNAALPFIRQIGIDDPIICTQGAVVRHPVTRELYAHTPIPGVLAAQALEELRQAGIYVIAYVDEWTCVEGEGPELDLYLRFHPGGESDLMLVPDLVEHVRETPPTKLLFIAEPDVLEQELASLSAHFTDKLSIVRSYAYFGEITAPGITKGAALAALAARLSIPSSDVVAIGDQENDISMLTWAGLGLAMGNAPHDVQTLADAVIPTVAESGVAWAIQNYLLNGQARYGNVVNNKDRTGIRDE